jgi:endonuclease G
MQRYTKNILTHLFLTAFWLLAQPMFAQNETFETASKQGYAKADVTATSGSWTFEDALIGTEDKDVKNGRKSVRIKDGGKITTNFDFTATNLSVGYGAYDADKNTALEVWISTDGGSTWKKAGVVSKMQSKLETARFGVNGKMRLQLRNTSNSGARINVDDITWSGAATTDNSKNNQNNQNETKPTPPPTVTWKDNDHLLLGNPSNAQTQISMPDNYLMVKKQYALSYNKSKGTPNWVAWHLNSAWKGEAARSKDFIPDATLPSGWYQVNTRDYSNSGFDRGHLCPSDDRDKSDEDNLATFNLTNIVPQTAKNNQETWRLLEEYCRRLATKENKEMYIIAGVYGKGGTNKDKEKKNEIANGKITVPARIWKIVVILDNANNDLQRINANTRVIAIDTPNMHNCNEKPLESYRVSVRELEKATGYNFFANLPQSLQDQLETQVDKGNLK